MDPVTSPAPMNDEIDLSELFALLWKEKVIIVATTFVFTLIAGGATFLSSPIYEASVQMLPPSLSDVAELDKFSVFNFLQSQSQPQSQSQLQSQSFVDFLQILNSNQLRNTFLSQEGVGATLFSPETSLQKSLVALEKMIGLETPGEDLLTGTSFNFRFKDPALAAEYANQLVQLAVDRYRANAAETFASKRDQEVKKLRDLQDSLISTHEARLNKEITKLEEAHEIARKLNIEEPRESKDMSVKSEARSTVITEELRYLYSQGTRALREEIETVLGRKRNHLMIDGLLDIEQRLAFINSVSFDPAKVTPVTIDLAAEAPEQRIETKRSLFVAIWAVVGGLLAIMFVLIRNAVRSRKVNAS
jgi:chain length determinant protein (polysaccharide antigen chain regulator)